MTVRFYMDVHVPRAVVVALRLRDIDILTAQQDGTATWDDAQLLNRASALNRVLVTQDSDLLREGAQLQMEGQPFAGIIYAHQRLVSIGQFIDSLTLIAYATSTQEWANRIAYLPL
ncbi:MAG: DUF5615 family PIN-like protein [Acidobacteria bacterium]|nr:DUF5615 family PIN-like protein [Acidobacteriota bacterium]